MGKKLRNEKWQRKLYLITILCIVAIFAGIAAASLPAPKVNAVTTTNAPVVTPVPAPPGPTPPRPTEPPRPTATPTPPHKPTVAPPSPTPTPTPTLKFVNVYLSPSTFQQGSSASIRGYIANVRTSVNLTVTLKKYYNSYSPYTVNTYVDRLYPNTDHNASLSSSSIFTSRLNLASRPAGHYLLVIEATESGKTISTSIHFYIT